MKATWSVAWHARNLLEDDTGFDSKIYVTVPSIVIHLRGERLAREQIEEERRREEEELWRLRDHGRFAPRQATRFDDMW